MTTMGTRTIAAALAAILALGGAAAVAAAPGRDGGFPGDEPGGGGGGPIAMAMRRAARELDLTRDQERQVREIVRSHDPEIRAAEEEVGVARRALRGIVLAPERDEEAIRRAADGVGEAVGSAAVLAARIAGEIAPVLTPEQKERVRGFIERRERRGAQDRERFRERGRDRRGGWE